MNSLPTSARLALPDILRGIAILAMVIAHAQPFLPQTPRPVMFVVGLISSMAAPLFALVMGMSAQLVWDFSRSSKARVFWRQGVKAVALIVLGIWMMTWGSWVAIVLQYLGVVLLIGVPLLLLPRITRLPLAVVLFAITPLVFQLLRGRTMELITQPGFDSGAPGTVGQRYAYDFLGSGSSYWPAELLAFFLVGSVLVGMHLTRSNAIVVLVAASALFLPIQLLLATDAYPAPSWVDIGRDITVVAFAYAVSTLVAEWRPLEWLISAVRDIGRVSLTIYLVHILFIAAYFDGHVPQFGYGRPIENVWWAWAVTVIAIPLWGMLWWRTVGVGPVEWLLNVLEARPRHPRHAIRAERASTAPTTA